MRQTLMVLILGAAGLLAGCKEKQHAAAAQPRPVLSIMVAPQAERTEAFAGTVEPRYRSDLGFRVLGRVVRRDVRVGDVVTRGQLLATVDPLTFQLSVRSAEADLAGAMARLENAAATDARQRILFEQNIATQAQIDAVRQGRETAEASVTRAKAELAKAEERLSYTELRADFGGVVVATAVEPGQVVQPGQTVVTVARPDYREAVVDLPESVGRGMRPGASLQVALQTDPAAQASGSVREISPQADPVTRTHRVRITLDSPPENFRLGTTITARVAAEASRDIVLPASAILRREGTSRVWVVDPATHTVSARDVGIAAEEGSTVRLSAGLQPGLRVVVAGVNSLIPGQTVKITDETP